MQMSGVQSDVRYHVTNADGHVTLFFVVSLLARDITIKLTSGRTFVTKPVHPTLFLNHFFMINSIRASVLSSCLPPYISFLPDRSPVAFYLFFLSPDVILPRELVLSLFAGLGTGAGHWIDLLFLFRAHVTHAPHQQHSELLLSPGPE